MNGGGFEVREKIAALFCLTLIAIVAMFRIEDPENIIVNIIVGISAFISGTSMRKTDRPIPGAETHTTEEIRTTSTVDKPPNGKPTAP